MYVPMFLAIAGCTVFKCVSASLQEAEETILVSEMLQELHLSGHVIVWVATIENQFDAHIWGKPKLVVSTLCWRWICIATGQSNYYA